MLYMWPGDQHRNFKQKMYAKQYYIYIFVFKVNNNNNNVTLIGL